MSQLQQIPFRAGIDEGTDPKQLPPGTLKEGINVRQDKLGRVRKRLGMSLLSGSDTDSGNFVARRLLGVGSATCASDAKDFAFPYGASGAWKRIDRVPSLASTVYPLADTTRTTTQATTIVVGTKRVSVFSTGLSGFAAASNAPVYVQVEDMATGAIVLPPKLVNSSAARMRVFSNGTDTAYVCYLTAAGDVINTPVNLSTYALGTPVTLASSVTIWDADLVGAVLYIAYVTGAGGIFIARGSITTGTMTHTENPQGAATYTECAIEAGGNYVRLIYSTTAPATRIVTKNPATLAAVAGPTTISATEAHALAILGTGGGTSGSMLIARTIIDGTYYCLTTRTAVYNEVTHAQDASAGDERTYHAIVASRLFAMASRYYFLATTAVIPPTIATSNATYVSPMSAIVLEANPSISNAVTSSALPHRRVATLESRTSSLQLYANTQTYADSDGLVHVAVARKQREPVGTEALPLGAVVHRLEVAGEDWGRTLAIGNSALGVASAPFFIDGPSCHPFGFIHEPDIIAASAGGGGSGSMGAGDYLYACSFEWRDARGIIHRSAPSAIVTVTSVPATGSVALRIACTTVDAKQSILTLLGATSASPVRIVLWRSTAGGSVLYRLTHEPTYNVLYNDPTNFSVTFTDTRSDTSITGGSSPAIRLDSRPQLYTGAELEEVNPSAATTGTIHRNRAWLLSADRRTLQASKKFDEDTELAPGFNEALTLLFATPKYALASLEDKLVALGADGLEIVFGDGPNSNGEQSDWQIQRVHSDMGCVNPKSVAVIPAGIVYRSPRGFELLDRGLGLTYIGAPVEDTLATYPVVTSAVLVPEEQEVRFSCTNADGDAGVVLAFSYAYRAWYTRRYRNPDTPDFDLPIIDARLVDGVYTMLGADGFVRPETPDACLDDGAYVSMRVSVPAYPTGAAGWARIRSVQVVGESMDHHKLTIAISRDFATSAEQTETFEDGGTVTNIGPLEQARVTLQHQKRQAAVVTIYDEEPDDESFTTGEGPILELLALVVEPKQGPAKVAAAQRG